MLCDRPVIPISPNSAPTRDFHYVMPREADPSAEPV